MSEDIQLTEEEKKISEKWFEWGEIGARFFKEIIGMRRRITELEKTVERLTAAESD